MPHEPLVPANYLEIADRQLQSLERDYKEVFKFNMSASAEAGNVPRRTRLEKSEDCKKPDTLEKSDDPQNKTPEAENDSTQLASPSETAEEKAATDEVQP